MELYTELIYGIALGIEWVDADENEDSSYIIIDFFFLRFLLEFQPKSIKVRE